LTLNIQKQRQFVTQDEEKELEKKIESITKSLRKKYFKNSLINLSKKIKENSNYSKLYTLLKKKEIFKIYLLYISNLI
jgi:hypothetical protein